MMTRTLCSETGKSEMSRAVALMTARRKRAKGEWANPYACGYCRMWHVQDEND